MLESGEFASIAELAEREEIVPSYMTRVLRLTLLPPLVLEWMMAGQKIPQMRLAQVPGSFPPEWSLQTCAGG